MSPQPASVSSFARRVVEPAGGWPPLELLEAGDPEGAPLLFFHGWPSGSIQGAVYHAAAHPRGLRVLAPNRPGIGRSAPDPTHSIASWPDRMAALADALGLERFRVLGVSGGGPYALATAWGLPDRVIACAVVSGAPPLHDKIRSRDLFWFYRLLIAVRDRCPGIARAGVRLADPFLRQPLPAWATGFAGWVLPARDVEATRSESSLPSFLGFREAMDSGAAAVMADGGHYTRPWGFDPAEIRVPVCLWHGTRDHNFAWTLVREFADRIPGIQARWVADEGHYSISQLRQEETLDALLAAGS